MSALKSEYDGYKMRKKEEFGWIAFIVFCMLGAAGMFFIAWLELS